MYIPVGIINLITQLFQAPLCGHEQSDMVSGMKQKIT